MSTLSTAFHESTAGMSDADREAVAAKLGPEAIRRATIMRCPAPGDLAQYLDPDELQTPALRLIDRALMWAYRTPSARLLITMGSQLGKALSSTAEVMSIRGDVTTPAGFRTMTELRIGDYVYHPTGKPIRVVAKTPAQLDRPLYRVTTTDGRSVVVDEHHEWTVIDKRRGKRVGGVPETMTTLDMLERGLYQGRNGYTHPTGTVSRSYAFRLPRQHAVQSADADLPISPYLFGLWLADGAKDCAIIHEGETDTPELIDHLRSVGTTIRNVETKRNPLGTGVLISVEYGAPGHMLRTLKDLGVFKNKHIPDVYLTAGTDQRLALLQGLLDGDGSITLGRSSNNVEYSSCIRELSEGVVFLARSLGWRAQLRTTGSTLNGIRMLDRHRVTFTPPRGEYPPFRLARKLERVQADKSRAGERHAVSIASIERVENGTAYCITVDSEDGLFLAGRDLVVTHNSQRVVNRFPLWCLQRNPNMRIVAASHSLELIQGHSRTTRNTVIAHGTGAVDQLTGQAMPDKLGFSTALDKAAAHNWAVEGHKGGMYVAGVGGSLTGRPADLLLIDDLYAGLTEAASPAVRRQVWDWYTGTALTRLAPTASVVMINTRFHPKDLIGMLLAADAEVVERGGAPLWKLINIPAIAGPGIPDSLGRPTSGPARYLTSPRGHTPEQWEAKRAELGEHAFDTIYQGNPTPAGATVFQSAWWERSRVFVEPAVTSRLVSVDPAESGHGDEAGILALASADDGRIVVTHDRSGLMRSDAWSRAASLLALEIGARWVVYEAYVAAQTYRSTLKTAWLRIREQAAMLLTARMDVEAAATRLIRSDKGLTSGLPREQLETELRELAGLPAGVLHRDMLVSTSPPWALIAHRGPPKAGKRQRAAGAAQAAETGRLVMLGRQDALESCSTMWMETDTDSPDRMDALSNGYVEIVQRAGKTVRVSAAAAEKATGTTPPPSDVAVAVQAHRAPRAPGSVIRSRARIGAPGSRR